MRLHLDFETFSEVDIGVGTHAYAAHPSTEALMLGWATDDDPVQVWDITMNPEMPPLLWAAIEGADEIWSYNAEFERLIMGVHLKLQPPLHKWRCCQVYAYSLGFAGRLNDVLKRFDIGDYKDAAGTRLIHRFSKPVRGKRIYPLDDIVQWGAFIEYCKQDVEVERKLWRKCARSGVKPNWLDYQMDQVINMRGLPIDGELVTQVLRGLDFERKRLIREMKGLCGVDNPNSVTQLQEWLQHRGYPYDNLQARNVAKALHLDLLPEVIEVLMKVAVGCSATLKKPSPTRTLVRISLSVHMEP